MKFLKNINGNTSYNGGIGFCGILAIVFITLKLVGYITWSWWWVLSPLWIPFVVVIVFMVVCFCAVFLSQFAITKTLRKRH